MPIGRFTYIIPERHQEFAGELAVALQLSEFPAFNTTRDPKTLGEIFNDHIRIRPEYFRGDSVLVFVAIMDADEKVIDLVYVPNDNRGATCVFKMVHKRHKRRSIMIYAISPEELNPGMTEDRFMDENTGMPAPRSIFRDYGLPDLDRIEAE